MIEIHVRSASCRGFKGQSREMQILLLARNILGFLLDVKCLRPDPKKTAAVTACPVPTNIKEFRRFFGNNGMVQVIHRA